MCVALRQAFYSFKDRFGLEQHAWPAAKGPVIDRFMAIMGVIAQLMELQIEQTRSACAHDNAFIERSCKHRRKQSDYVDFHYSRETCSWPPYRERGGVCAGKLLN